MADEYIFFSVMNATMRKLILRGISTIGTIVTAIAILAAQTPPTIAKLALVILIAVAIGVTALDILAYFRSQPRRYELNSHEIKDYLVSWLKSGGRAAVFSRDLSWANGGSASDVLESKADRHELLLFVGRQTSRLEHLAAKGAEVYDYSSSGFEPKSRFTIVDYGKTGARVAIGFQENNKHSIYEYRSSDHAVMALANDLVALARSGIARRKHDER